MNKDLPFCNVTNEVACTHITENFTFNCNFPGKMKNYISEGEIFNNKNNKHINNVNSDMLYTCFNE